MKYIKTFEHIKNSSDIPKVGDYVQLKVSKELPKFVAPSDKEWLDNRSKFIDFMNNNLGKIVKVRKYQSSFANPNQPMIISPTTGQPVWNTTHTIDDYSLSITWDNIPTDILEWFEHDIRDKDINGNRTFIYNVKQGMNKVVAFGETPDIVRLKSVTNKYNL